MKNYSNLLRRFSVLCLIFGSFFQLLAKDGDTIKVRTVEFTDPYSRQAGTYLFPPKSEKFQKILMNYKLKCPSNGPCGEWDYLMYVYLDHKTGTMDSTLLQGPNFTVNGSTRATFSYVNNPAWTYSARAEKFTSRQSTQRDGDKNSQNATISPIGTGVLSVNMPFNTQIAGGHSQFLWTASELKAAGLLAGDITGIRFNILQSGSGINRLAVQMKAVSFNQLDLSSLKNSGFQTVFERNLTLQTGWQNIPFTQNFTWDGTSNIIVDISQNNRTDGQSSLVAATATTPNSLSAFQAIADSYAKFDGSDYIVSTGKEAIQTGTVEARFNVADVNGQHYIVSNDRDAGAEFPGYHLFLNGNKLYAAIWTQSDNKIVTISGGTVVPNRWYHSAMTFDGKNFILYLDGQEIARQTLLNSTTIEAPLLNFMIGILAFQAPTYYKFNGGIDEVRVWNQPLSAITIQQWMNRQVNSSHSAYSNLVAYFPLNEGVGFKATDVKGGNHGYFAANKGNWGTFSGSAINISDSISTIRPNVLFEQGLYTATTDSVFVVDSVKKDPKYVIEFNNASKPGKPTDTLYKWEPYYHFTFDSKGNIKDSTLIPADQTLSLFYRPFYGDPFEVVQRFELMRYITPYGNGLNLGNGFTWIMDVTDFALLLHDSVTISAYNQQELVELTFDMISGAPPREVLDIKPLWFGNPQFGNTPSIDKTFLTPRKIFIPNAVKGEKLRVIQSGHGFAGDAENCSEFCDKIQYIKVADTIRYQNHVWRETCGLNPVYPQGGTWVYSRSRWCPGAEVQPFDYELTPFIKSGDTALVDMDMQQYNFIRTGNGTAPNYVISSCLFEYGAPNFKLDASLEKILAPTKDQFYRRHNPVCGSPIIRIRNNGSTPLTVLDIHYGFKGGAQATFTWKGNLKFTEEQEVSLPPLALFGNLPQNGIFEVLLDKPNGGTDEYASNNYGSSEFVMPPVLFNEFEVRLTTNLQAAQQYEWSLKKTDGTVIAQHSNLQDNTSYLDSLYLTDGCYEFRFTNKWGYGLSWWATSPDLGSGAIEFTSLGNSLPFSQYFVSNHNSGDFGSELYQQFIVASKPTTTSSTDSLNFGTVEVGSPKQLSVDISPKNAIGLEVSLAKINVSNRNFRIVSTVPDLSAGTVKLGATDKLTITVEFAPVTPVVRNARLDITTNDERFSPYSVYLTGTGAWAAGVSEDAKTSDMLTLSAVPSVISEESTVSFSVNSLGNTPTRVTLVNTLGQEVATLFDGIANADGQTAKLDAHGIASGTYFIVLRSLGMAKTLPVSIVR